MNSRGATEFLRCEAGEGSGGMSESGSDRATTPESCNIHPPIVVRIAHTGALRSINVITRALIGGGSASAAPYPFG
jgi:hypothetical protein